MLHKRLVRVCVLQAVLWSVRSSPTQAPSLSLSHSDEQTVAASFDPKSLSSLVLLQLLFRHGDRSAIHLFPWDQHHSAWPQGPGQLTKVGMEQTYKYGGELRKMYASFLPTQYDRFAVAVQSTDYDRTLMTAQCLLVGLFPANSSQWSLSPWQPIPIHTGGALFGHAPCPMIEVLNKQKDYAEKSENLKLKYKPLVDDLSSGTNTSVNISVASLIADTMFCEAEHNMSRPVWMTEAMFEGLMNLTDSNYQLQYTAPGVPRLAGGPLLAEMTSNMERRAHNSSKEKLFLFSGHDSTVSALGQAMGTFNEVKPPYLTTIIVELHQQGPAFFVKTLFHNHTDNSPYVTNIEGCAQMCPLSEFRRLLTDRMLPAAGREEACALTVSTASQFWRDNGASVLLGVVMVMVVTVTVLAYKLRKGRVPQRERNHVRYHKLLQHGAHNDDDDHVDS